jgi:hypothetical protein
VAFAARINPRPDTKPAFLEFFGSLLEVCAAPAARKPACRRCCEARPIARGVPPLSIKIPRTMPWFLFAREIDIRPQNCPVPFETAVIAVSFSNSPIFSSNLLGSRGRSGNRVDETIEMGANWDTLFRIRAARQRLAGIAARRNDG